LDYLLLANSLAWAVYISGPLLLAWIAATAPPEAPARRHDPGRPTGQSRDQPSGP
jgi:hypothetical protein